MSPAEEHTLRSSQANNKRLDELIRAIEKAGVAGEFYEVMFILKQPCKAYSERIRDVANSNQESH